jgi:hypothetical protein
MLNAAAVPAEGAWNCFLKEKSRSGKRFPMPDTHETEAPRRWGGEPPHVSDAPHISPDVSPAIAGEDPRVPWRSRLSWSAILAGVVIALITQLLLNLIGIALGAASLAPLSGSSPSAASFSIGAGIWFVISSILAALVGGYAAGRLSGAQQPTTAGWHGLTAWALSMLLLSYLLSSAAGGILGGLAGGLGDAAKSTAQNAVHVAAPAFAQMADPFSTIEQSLRSSASGNDPAAMRDAAIAAMRVVVAEGPESAADAREHAAQAMERALNIPAENARMQVQHYEQQYRQAVDQAKTQAAKAADDAAKAVSRAALLGALGLLLGAAASWLGGRMAAGDLPRAASVRAGSGRSLP